MSDPSFEYESSKPKGLWRQNHGTVLLAVMILISIIGAGIIAYQQNRFRKPRFPSGRAINTPGEEVDLVTDDGRPVLKIIVVGAINDNGVMRVAVYNTATEFNQPLKAAIKAPQAIVAGVAEWTVPLDQLPASFAMAAFHDENDDSILNKNTVGIPIERYGFSNNARSTFGPPSFDQAVISRPEESETIEIYIR